MRLPIAFFFTMSLVPASELHIRVADDAGQPVWARLEVRGTDGKMYKPEGTVSEPAKRMRFGSDHYYVGSFLAQGECRVEVPPGRYVVIAEKGLEYERLERTVEAPAEVAFTIRPWIRMRELGWWSGDLHVHRASQGLAALMLAEDVNLSANFTIWNKRNLWRDQPVPDDPVVRASPNHIATLLNAEDERGGGAWLLNSLRKPLDMAVDGRWFPAGITFVEQARAQHPPPEHLPWFDCEKPIWWETPVMMALATPESLGAVHNHFTQYGIYDSEVWGRPRDQKQFPGREGFVDYSLSLYYRYLNLGFKLVPSAGSATGVLPNPLGYNRVYVKLAGPFTVHNWYQAFHDGPSFATNGPILFFEVKGKGKRRTVSIDARAREPIDRVELVANGQVIRRFTPQPGAKSFRGESSFDSSRYSWIAARCFLKPGATIRLAQSSPVYLAGRPDARADAKYFLDWIDELTAQTKSDAKRFRSEGERTQVMSLYERARQYYENKAR